jgi:membrane protease YdiL (CAAX protease family)
MIVPTDSIDDQEQTIMTERSLTSMLATTPKQVFSIRWNPNRDLVVVAISWLLVVGALYTATTIIGQTVWGGIAYFLIYAVIGAALCGVGIPLYWTVVVRKRPISDLGLTSRRAWLSIALQMVFAVLLFIPTLLKMTLPPLQNLIPLIALALTIGFFEAIFWRGWVLLRLEESFGLLPAILLGSVLYAAYHIGYGMPSSEMVFLFFVGLMYAVVFLLTRNILILWPVFQPMGQLVTLVKDGLTLPLAAALGFIEVLILMFVFVWLAARYYQKHHLSENAI